jgi:deoxyribonuclease-4
MKFLIIVMRVRRLITQFSYPDLVRTLVIPDLSLYTPDVATKRYPPWVYALKKNHESTFCAFGLFVENVIASVIANDNKTYSTIWSQYSEIPLPTELVGQNNFIGGIVTWAQSIFKGFQVEHEPTFKHKNVEGHPDFISKTEHGTWILDCKTTSGFKSMAQQTYLQILAYCALARARGDTCNYIGILLPLQRQVLWYNLTEWDETHYLSLLVRESKWVQKDAEIYNVNSLIESVSVMNKEEHQIVLGENIVGLPARYLTSGILGHHMSKEAIYDPSFKEIMTPIQIFIANPQGKGFVSQEDLLVITNNTCANTRLFIHSPYIINLCSDEEWGIERLRHELLAGQQINSKGVVVHVGKYTNQSIEEGLNKMEANIRKVLDIATKECPLIIESPASQGSELCAGLEELQAFYDRFNGTPNLKICVDTCHIFAAGYDPEFYLKSWIKRRPGAVVLVHFNDASILRGSRVDRHYPAGLGYIGYKRLWAVHELCREHNIPMVTE